LDKTLVTTPNDPVVPAAIIDRFHLRPGLELEVELSFPRSNGQQQQQQQQSNHRPQHHRHPKHKPNPVSPMAPRVQSVLKIDGLKPEEYLKRPRYEDLTTIDPSPRLTLEYPGCPPACRLIDLFCPIGYGQRGLIVSPPKAGKTTLLQNIAVGLSKNHPQVEVIALLIDERPEEVTDFRRNVPCKVLASSNDHTPDKHASLAMLAIERAKRMAEAGKHLVILLDSLTRIGRAFNNLPSMASTGRTLSGGLDAGSLAIPKQLFGAARKFEEGGSLTILATALIDTGSRGDQVIFEEFKGTGNMELILDRKIAERRVFPAIDLAASGTRKEHLLVSERDLATISALRRRLMNMPPHQQLEQLLKALDRFKTNADLLGNPQSPANEQG
jgi:transcription termination factor Rho